MTNTQPSDEDDTVYQELINDKGKHARRRELEAVREPGRLRKWFEDDWGWLGRAYRQTARAWASRAAYHFHPNRDRMPCGVDKRQWRQNERHTTRQELRKLR